MNISKMHDDPVKLLKIEYERYLLAMWAHATWPIYGNKDDVNLACYISPVIDDGPDCG